MKTLLRIGLAIVFVIGMPVGMSYSLASDLTTTSNNGTLTIVFGSAPEFAASADLNFATEAAPVSTAKTTLPATTSSVVQTAAVPEPATLVLMGLGLLGLFGIARKRTR